MDGWGVGGGTGGMFPKALSFETTVHGAAELSAYWGGDQARKCKLEKV